MKGLVKRLILRKFRAATLGASRRPRKKVRRTHLGKGDADGPRGRGLEAGVAASTVGGASR